MKKKLAIIIIILLASGGITWAILNQSKDSKQQTTPLTKESSQKPKIPGGEKIIDQDSSTKDQISKELSKNQGQKQPDSSSHSTHDNQHSSQQSQQSSQKPNTSRPNTQGQTQPQTQGPSQPLNPPIKPPKPNTPPTQPQPQPPVTPPVIPPAPPQPPITPPQPPKPPKPPVNPPNQNLTDEEKARKIISDLKSSTNQNIAQFTNDDGQIRTVLWTKGITGPRLGSGGDFKRIEETHGNQQFINYATGYRDEFLRSGWYDTDKTHGSSNVDRLLCFGAVAANQLHWWMNYHKDRVEQFIAKTDYRNNLPPSQRGTFKDLTTYQNSFKSQQNSQFFKMFSLYFGNNSEGYYADPLIDMFINGHKPKPGGGYNDPDWQHNFQMDSRGGFFHDVFDKRNITQRITTINFNDFAEEIKKAFRDGRSAGIIHHTSAQNTHIITAWGLEYDLDGRLVAVYITDSDDQDDPKTSGMKRYGVRNVNNKAVMSTNVTNLKAGGVVDSISTLGLGEDKWSEYLK